MLKKKIPLNKKKVGTDLIYLLYFYTYTRFQKKCALVNVEYFLKTFVLQIWYG